MENESQLFSKIAEALLKDYVSIYYVNARTNAYYCYANHAALHTLQIADSGEDFFEAMATTAGELVYEEDRHLFLVEMQKANLLRVLKKGSTESIVYRLKLDGKLVYHSMRLIREAKDGDDYFVLGVVNVDEEVRERLKQSTRLEKERDTFGLIAESLAKNYDMIYYVNSENEDYAVFTINKLYGNLEVQEDGKEFFANAHRNAGALVHPEDVEKVRAFLTKENLVQMLSENKQSMLEYRLLLGGEIRYVRMIVMHASDHVHIIIGVENISEEMEKKQAEMSQLQSVKEKATRDELTHAKNKNAYQDLENELQQQLEADPKEMAFGIIVCDLNNLKKINDTQGHKAGDAYIKECCQILFDTFSHSPVFRIGGDEFVVCLRDRDYRGREELFATLRDQILDNLDRGEGAVAATGMAVYEPGRDRKVADVFERADSMMYSDKRRLKERKSEAADLNPEHKAIPSMQKLRLDGLFEALSVIAEGGYVYICDIKYNFSRWSEAAVRHYGLPGEYMYVADKIWEKRIHPQDRAVYHAGIEAVFNGTSGVHDMQYRVMNVQGGYDICTCRGIVTKDSKGELEHFMGVIRNHGQEDHLDSLTGLPNQYGFFEETRKRLQNGSRVHLCMLGIRKFSDINEMYGYRHGNRVIQRFGRVLLDYVGSDGIVYRLDGTRFGLILNILSFKENQGRYEELRDICRKGIEVDGKRVTLELNAGIFDLEEFDINEETIHACLSYAYDESKTRRQGDMVEFYSTLNEENRDRVEKLHMIHDSIAQDFKGFYLMYQPVIDAKTEALLGAEALIRWGDEEVGMVPPDVFIPIIEKDPLFSDLGEWILRTALKDAIPFLGVYPEFTINVNLSYTQLEKPDFTDMVCRVLEEMSFPPDHLCLEITERCRVLNPDLLKSVIVKLRGRGIKVALDDFGTGFSAMGLIKDIPFDVIKIDRSFVKNVVKSTRERALIDRLAQIASIYGAKVCVEGVEDEDTRNVLLNYEIKSFQGYYYAKPLTIERFRTGQWQDDPA